jgi:hypothetical protein
MWNRVKEVRNSKRKGESERKSGKTGGPKKLETMESNRIYGVWETYRNRGSRSQEVRNSEKHGSVMEETDYRMWSGKQKKLKMRRYNRGLEVRKSGLGVQ